MTGETLRSRIASEAARLMHSRRESDYLQAKRTAARRVCGGWARSSDLPTDLEIREELQRYVSVEEPGAPPDRFEAFRTLLEPLELIQQRRVTHPEGDVLYHSLQVFELVRQKKPYDEDLLLAALLHDVGKGIDPADHVTAGLAVLDGLISDRTAWLIEHHLDARARREGNLGARAARRLRKNENYDDLDFLCECDRAGRVSGAEVFELEAALGYLKSLEQNL